MSALCEAVLGETAGDMGLESAEDNRAATRRMLAQTRRELAVVSRRLDPDVYEDPEVLEALRQLALRSRYSRIRLLVAEPDSVVARDHRVLELARKHSAFIELRVPAEEDAQFNDVWLLADTAGLIRRPLATRFQGIANFNDPPRVSELRRRFDTLWDRAERSSEFLRLHL